jgi:aryl-alcohol dehydrogenase-like predicted oxidoreductase
MKYCTLGKKDLKISKMGFGCANFGGIGSVIKLRGKGDSEETAKYLLDRSIDIGINFFDTANSYGGGRSETFIGNWILKRKIREKIIISSKVGSSVGDTHIEKGLKKEHIFKQIDLSLKRLCTDYLDIYFIHEPDPDIPVEETLDSLNMLVKMGKVKYLGASNVTLDYIKKTLQISKNNSFARFDVIQNSYNLNDRKDETTVLLLCKEKNIGYIAYGPLCGGLLAGKYEENKPFPKDSRYQLRPEYYNEYINNKTFEKLKLFREFAKDRSSSMASIAIAWILNNPQITLELVSPRNDIQFQSIIEALQITLSDSEIKELGKIFH